VPPAAKSEGAVCRIAADRMALDECTDDALEVVAGDLRGPASRELRELLLVRWVTAELGPQQRLPRLLASVAEIDCRVRPDRELARRAVVAVAQRP
jgi:hypothetical protein